MEAVRIGDELQGPQGNVVVTTKPYEGEVERDIIDVMTSGGVLQLTKDHRVEVFRCNKHLVCAVGDLVTTGDHLFTSPEETLEVKRVSRRISSNGVYFVRFEDDKSAYIRSASGQVVSKGCPGDPKFKFAARYGSESDDPQHSRRSQSAPAKSRVLQQSRHETSVIFKRRRIDDPPVLDILKMLARRAQCGDIFSQLNLPACSKHEVILPSELAEDLRHKIKHVYAQWCDERLAMNRGRSSKLVWKLLVSGDP